ncbi:MAG: helix-turn-helix domain-containing protein [Lachnospiraceae bacterium]|nr:helix-turn-helix domain-containing protein [Lachnospiraceae bacterium]
MKNDYVEACMNSTRQRILQAIMLKQQATPTEIGEALTDIPRASLYRHIKILLDANVISIVKEINKRGSIEKTYAMASPAPTADPQTSAHQLVQSALMSLQMDFGQYFAGDTADPARDLLTVGSASLMLTDDEMKEFYAAYGELLSRYLQKKPDENRKVRKVSLIVSPVPGSD